MSQTDGSCDPMRMEEVKFKTGRSTLEKILAGVAVVLFVLVIVFIILFAASVNKESESDKKECTTRNCVMASSQLAAKMDFKADPCENFAQYACGGFIRDTLIPDDKNGINSFSIVADATKQTIRLLIEEDLHDDDPEYVRKVKTYYKSCMDLDKIEEVGLKHYKSTEQAKEWPTTNAAWDISTFDLNATTEKFGRAFSSPLVVFGIEADFSDSTKFMLHVTQPNSEIPRTTLLGDRNSTILKAYEEHYKNVAVAIGADPRTAEADAEAYYDFQVELAKIVDGPEAMMDLSSLINPSTLSKMTETYPYLDFYRTVQSAYETANMTLSKDQPINILNPNYFKKLGKLLMTTDNRVIQNVYGYDYSSPRIDSYTKEMLDLKKKLNEVVDGKQIDTPIWMTCLGGTKLVFGEAVAKMFIRKEFSEESKKFMNEMVDNLDSSFEGILKEVDWMESNTKEAAFEKLHHMKRKIGYPDENFSDEDIDENYKDIRVIEGQFYQTSIDIIYKMRNDNLRLINQLIDKTTWKINPTDVNAIYEGTSNEISFPAGILQPPFFSPHNPSSVNFGAIGVIIGHEITHGFDQGGSQFDHTGSVKNWWHSKDLEEFEKRSQCVIDKYGAFKVEEVDMNINGKLTVKENTADLGGLKEGYRAYKKYAASHPEELPLPGLGLTTDKQFFLAFAQLWCTKETKTEQRRNLIIDNHSPGKYRIIGTLQNTQEFADVFQCPSGSFMNPAEKCVVW